MAILAAGPGQLRTPCGGSAQVGDAPMGYRVYFYAGLSAVTLASAPLHADTRAGVEAWTRGDFANAVEAWQAELPKGDADAMFNLGQAYKLGNGVKQDLAMAESLFGRAAALGHIQASDNYGMLLFQRGERRQALPYLRAGADRGDPRAQYLLGIGHFNGDIVNKDWLRAYALVSLAQQAGLPQAAVALSQMDRHLPLAQRQQAVVLAAELRSQAEGNRARQLAAVELGTIVPNGSTPRPPAAGSDVGRVSASQAAGAARVVESGAQSAGADYARPSAGRPVAPRPPAASAIAVRPVAAAPAQSTPAQSTPALSAATGAGTGPWRIQLGAFGLAANADNLWNRLKGRPELAGKPRINARAGTLIKLQAGGFASEAAARAACNRLASAGQTCLAVRN